MASLLTILPSAEDGILPYYLLVVRPNNALVHRST